jgi:uncharacterized OB-fold protein
MDSLLEMHRQAVLAHPSCQPFWDATREGQLLLPRCTDCARHHWYPRTFCPLCQSAQVRWQAASGRARVHACTSLLRDPTRTVFAFVELDEGPLMLTHLVGRELEAWRIGDALQVEFRALETGLHLPVFRASDEPPA